MSASGRTTPHALAALSAAHWLDGERAEAQTRSAIDRAVGGGAFIARHRLLEAWAAVRAGRTDDAVEILQDVTATQRARRHGRWRRSGRARAPWRRTRHDAGDLPRRAQRLRRVPARPFRSWPRRRTGPPRGESWRRLDACARPARTALEPARRSADHRRAPGVGPAAGRRRRRRRGRRARQLPTSSPSDCARADPPARRRRRGVRRRARRRRRRRCRSRARGPDGRSRARLRGIAARRRGRRPVVGAGGRTGAARRPPSPARHAGSPRRPAEGGCRAVRAGAGRRPRRARGAHASRDRRPAVHLRQDRRAPRRPHPSEAGRRLQGRVARRDPRGARPFVRRG